MDGDASALGVHSGAEHFGRTEKDADFAFVHGGNHCLAGLFGLGFLDEAHFIGRDAVVFYQLALYLAVGVPFAGLVSAEVAEDELRAFVLVVFL